jgi:hypothetical protein
MSRPNYSYLDLLRFFKEGYDARLNGLTIKTNPYLSHHPAELEYKPLPSAAHDAWNQGWHNAARTHVHLPR